jgi:hypothetical protein
VGVCWHKASKKWHAELTFKKIKVLSAFFDKYEDAVKSRKDAEKQFEITY